MRFAARGRPVSPAPPLRRGPPCPSAPPATRTTGRLPFSLQFVRRRGRFPGLVRTGRRYARTRAPMPEIPPTRASLLLRLRDPHDGDAWKEFVGLYMPLVYGYARKQG